jgi:hypothetical protein
MLDHLSIQCADVAASAAVYDAVLSPPWVAGRGERDRQGMIAPPMGMEMR